MPPGKCTCQFVFVLMLAATGCSVNSDSHSVLRHISIVNDQQIDVHADNGPDAVISSAGDLAVGGKNVALDQNQKILLVRYFASTLAVRNDGEAVGAAGARTAGQALSSVAAGLTGGDPDKIGAEIDASAAIVDAAAAKLCNDLAQLHSAQDSLAATLADFRPYALINAQDLTDCSVD